VDRGFVHFGFINAVLDKASEIVLRMRASDQFTVETNRPLTGQDIAHGVLSDSVGRLPGSSQKKGKSRTTAPPTRQMRLVVCSDPATGQSIRILTSLMDVPAYVIGLLYRQRWQIELFFRWLKVWANFDHLLSHSPEGIRWQFYVAVIGCLLMHIATGRKVNKYTMFLLGQVAMGLATLEQIMPMLDKIEREKELERARRARKKALPKMPKQLPA
jgi:IS4 transposase